MAKSDTIFNIRGRLGDLIFCKRDGTSYVKRYSGGFTKAATQNHPNIKVGQERFAQVSRYVKNLKQQLQPYLWRQKDGTFHNQLMAIFLQMAKNENGRSFNELIKELDSYSTTEWWFVSDYRLFKRIPVRKQYLAVFPACRGVCKT